MKDIKDREIAVGDIVVCSGGSYKQLVEAKVMHVTPQTCQILELHVIAQKRYDKSCWTKKVDGQVLVLDDTKITELKKMFDWTAGRIEHLEARLKANGLSIDDEIDEDDKNWEDK